MNKLLSLVSSLLIFTSCGNTYKIEGSSSVNSLDGKMVYLKMIKDGTSTSVDSAEVVHGNFKMKGKVDSTMMVTLFLDNEGIMPLVLEQGKINVSVDYNKLSARGTYLNEKLYDFIDKRNALDLKIDELDRKEVRLVMEGANIDDVQLQINKEAEDLVNEMNTHVKTFISTNYENVLGPGVFIMLCSGLPYPMMTPQIDEILKDAPYTFKSNALVKEFVNKAKENMELIEEHRRMRESEMVNSKN